MLLYERQSYEILNDIAPIALGVLRKMCGDYLKKILELGQEGREEKGLWIAVCMNSSGEQMQ